MNKFKSGFFNGLGKAIYWFFQFFIVIFSFLTNIVDEIRSIILTVIGMGCIFIFFTPFLLAFFMKPVVFTLTIFFIGFPLLGKILVSFLKYEQFVTTEFLQKLSFTKQVKVKIFLFLNIRGYLKKRKKRQEEKESLRKEKLKRKHIGGHLKNSLEMQEELIIDSLMEGEVVSIILPIKQSQTLRMNMKKMQGYLK